MKKPKIIPVDPVGTNGEALVVIRGFLSEGKDEPKDHGKWLAELRKAGWQGTVYALWWDASHGPKVWKWWRVKARAKKVGREHFCKLIGTIAESPITVVAYSAGARVLYHGLATGKVPPRRIKDVVLLGGAIKFDGDKDCAHIVNAISGTLLNVFSTHDTLLKKFYSKDACGRNPVKYKHPRFRNRNASNVVKGGFLNRKAHKRYKGALDKTVGAILWAPVAR